ncbi:MAG: L-seryl-tRNA(Sec) selenium transferase, partial [Actinobacteria bacterium]|nr:L-seryl-tRNA(Sec) selenium transferase [Actinomycetota bacterium]
MTSAGDDGVSRRLRSLPSVERVARALGPDAPSSPIATAMARLAVDRARARVRAGESLSFEEIESDAVRLLETRSRARLSKIINATGVLIHTNLGRSPLGEKQMEAVQRVASGYSNLEYDIDAGRRGSRYAHARAPLVALTGAQSALVVNNCAAALLLTLTGLCKDREVIISRGELVEIGGEFRIPDVLAASGARLKEIGTTNRTHLIDYERAIGPETGAILKVHPSNYKMLGFTAAVEARALARLARGRGVLFINDLGSGLINSPSHAPWLEREPTVEAAVAGGADIVTFSGDKLLGGPQAGMIVGRSELIDTLARHPLLRALRVDKMTLAALEATFEILLRGTLDELP